MKHLKRILQDRSFKAGLGAIRLGAGRLSQKPVISGCASFALGIAVADIAESGHPIIAFSALGACFAALLLIFARRSNLIISLALPLIFLAGFLRLYTFSSFVPPDHLSRNIPDGRVNLEGFISRFPEKMPERTRAILDIKAISKDGIRTPTSGRLMLTIYESANELSYGDSVLVEKARVRKPFGFKNPGSFDYAKYMKTEGIDAVTGISNKVRIKVVGREPVPLPMMLIYKMKERMESFLDRRASKVEAALIRALVLGQKGQLDEGLNKAFYTTGTAHLLAVSGSNIAFIAMAFYLIFRVLFKLIWRFTLIGSRMIIRPSKIAAAATILPVLFYAGLVGGGISVIRAAIMALTYILMVLLDRGKDTFNALALAALIILIFYPGSLFGASFQLSFMAVFAILLLNELFLKPKPPDPLEKLEAKGKKRLLPKLYSYAAVSFIATLATAPLVAYHFTRVSLVGFLANIFIVPLASVLVPLGIISLFVATFYESVAAALLMPSLILSHLLIYLLNFFASFPLAHFHTFKPDLATMGLIYGAIFSGMMVKKRPLARVILGGFIAAFLISTSIRVVWGGGGGILKVTFLDIGQGDSAFVQFPNGKNMIIDGGPARKAGLDAGEMIVTPFLLSKWIWRVDALVASHGHPDHAGGLEHIWRTFNVGQAWGDVPFSKANDAGRLAPWRSAKELARIGRLPIDGGGATVKVMHPSPLFPTELAGEGDKAINNNSIVLKLEYGQVSFLFTGDIESEAEDFLIRSRAGLRSTILKVPHHGSYSSSGDLFIKAVTPEVAVISAALGNIYNFPNKRALERYEKHGVSVFRTDLMGAVKIVTDGQSYSVTTQAKAIPPISIKRVAAGTGR